MKYDQFAFWLQGHFELADHFNKETLTKAKESKDQFLTGTQVVCIKNHIRLHFECCLRENIEPNQFVCWLDGSLAYFDKLPQPEQELLVIDIKKRLGDLFIHHIDPKMPGDVKSLQDIHDGKGKEGKKKQDHPMGRGKHLERRGGGSGRDRRLMC